MNVSKRLKNFELYLNEAEKSRSTIEKYVRDVRAFFRFIDGKVLTKNTVIEYKKKITEEYAPASVNSMLASINCFFAFC